MSEVGSIAVAISKTGPAQKHVGFFLRPIAEAGRLVYVHFGWEGPRFFCCEEPATESHWLGFDAMSEDALIALDNVADIVYELFTVNKPTGLPYSIVLRDGVFSPSTLKPVLDFGEGFTCGTFVMAALSFASIEIIERDSWPNDRPEDAIWHQQIVNTLRAYTKVPVAPLQLQQIGRAARFRPEEVTGAVAAYEGAANTFEVIEPLSLAVLDQMAA